MADTGQGQEHNDDQEFQEKFRAALNQIGDLTKTLITVATGTLALSATLLKSFGSDSYIALLYGGWLALAASTIFGIMAILEQIGQLATKAIDNPVQCKTLRWCNGIQLAGLLAGLALLGFFAVVNLNKGAPTPRTPAAPACTKPAWPTKPDHDPPHHDLGHG